MQATKANIIAQLQKDILPLQGCKRSSNGDSVDAGLGPIKDAFPDSIFPFNAVHEFFCTGKEEASASGGFIASILSTLMRSGGVCLWISSCRTIFPPAFKSFGIAPDKIIFIDLQKEKDILWAMEEALKCDGLAAVVGEMQELSFTASRRLQLIVEQSRVTGFILRQHPRTINITACVTRWRITCLPSVLANDMPGVGFPRWNVELLKVRNGKPGTWQIEWKAGKFKPIHKLTSLVEEQQKKTG
jgi:protein ImuA